jgi:hypothetical protein
MEQYIMMNELNQGFKKMRIRCNSSEIYPRFRREYMLTPILG